jgi:hypothetical protein
MFCLNFDLYVWSQMKIIDKGCFQQFCGRATEVFLFFCGRALPIGTPSKTGLIQDREINKRCQSFYLLITQFLKAANKNSQTILCSTLLVRISLHKTLHVS